MELDNYALVSTKVDTAIIICGGKGTRVRSITKDTIPKICININGFPFLYYLLSTLITNKIRNIYLATGFLSEVIESCMSSDLFTSFSPNVIVEKEDYPLGTGGSVLSVIRKYNINRPTLIINGDTLITPPLNFSEILLSFRHLNHPLFVMLMTNLDNDGSYGVLNCQSMSCSDGTFVVESFSSGSIGKSFINCGWYIVDPGVFESLNFLEVCSMENDLIPSLVSKGFVTAVEILPDRFLDIGTSEKVDKVRKVLI
jgi:NDP-sugar pyrophosphorylase family protein